ncbi:MAG: hypothetical protein ACT4P4_25785 [Betaproteobacteria bacterium]
MNKKTCLKCQAEVHLATSPKPKKAAEVPAVDASAPAFSCGPALDGGAILNWPRTGEQLVLKPGEWAFVQALAILTHPKDVVVTLPLEVDGVAS